MSCYCCGTRGRCLLTKLIHNMLSRDNIVSHVKCAVSSQHACSHRNLEKPNPPRLEGSRYVNYTYMALINIC